MSAPTLTPKQELIESRLECSLQGWVKKRRAKNASWQKIADEIHGATGVTVSGQALRLWYPELIGAER